MKSVHAAFCRSKSESSLSHQLLFKELNHLNSTVFTPRGHTPVRRIHKRVIINQFNRDFFFFNVRYPVPQTDVSAQVSKVRGHVNMVKAEGMAGGYR